MIFQLVDLKAELARKQAQFNQQKLHAKDGVRKKAPTEKKPPKWVKQNAGVADRAKRDMESVASEDNSIEKSRRALEAKAKMYDQLMNKIPDENDEEDGESLYLVDFQKKSNLRRKEDEEKERRRKEKEEEEAEEKLLKEKIPEPEDSDEQWVDYVDSFGRSRRCMKRDLPKLVAMDEDLTGKKKPEVSNSQKEYSRDLMSADMIREEQRKKWEQEELDAINGPLHYSNVRFDEIRSHGTGFFQFGKTEEERGEQMKSLHNLREQTLSLREKKEQLKAKRLAAVQARLAKVKQRKMVQEGAPLPESLVEDLDPMNMKPKEEEPVEMLVRDEALRQDAPTRDWDRGKKVIDLDTDYVSKRRQERDNEFAPPSFYYDRPNRNNYREEEEEEEEEEEDRTGGRYCCIHQR
ncbi:hypothetical protein CAPTEDRAFT_181155 [Capitella teleta]|uniref:CCDC174 alpha/beta GRSR domain-containing protein n=1 Tax=Capitella teleta TaxID=283909 RepID=R7TJ18_CAPTE|nr:hypothetical protein CAPTEDRAFT_181155 [Capitella teleta]|eukprot:ELT91100.1 hypothetical protein CAPTEDRAFT_181155 [Capitella teleta]